MTTNQQRRLYFPAWAKAQRANWRFEAGMPVLLDRPAGEERARLVDAVARGRARQRAARCAVDDLRRACHLIVLERDVSSTLLSNAELDRVLAYFRLLADAADLGAVMDEQNPAAAARRRKIHGLERCGVPEAQLRAWSGYWNGGEHEWRLLPDARLAAFSRYVWQQVFRKKRRTVDRSRKAEGPKAPPVADPLGINAAYEAQEAALARGEPRSYRSVS